jgi:prepilin-type N-terminal cleavage/methylation domain-containing protein
MPRRKPEQGGFTLVEVLVSLVLSAIAMIGIIALYRAQTNASSFSRRTTEATMLAEDQVERLRTQVGLGSATTASLDETGKVVSGGVFTRFFEVTAPNANYDEIRVIVSWPEEGQNKAVTVFGRRNK